MLNLLAIEVLEELLTDSLASFNEPSVLCDLAVNVSRTISGRHIAVRIYRRTPECMRSDVCRIREYGDAGT